MSIKVENYELVNLYCGMHRPSRYHITIYSETLILLPMALWSWATVTERHKAGLNLLTATSLQSDCTLMAMSTPIHALLDVEPLEGVEKFDYLRSMLSLRVANESMLAVFDNHSIRGNLHMRRRGCGAAFIFSSNADQICDRDANKNSVS